MRTIGRSTARLAASRSAEELSDDATALLVASESFELAIWWKLAPPALVPVSAAFVSTLMPPTEVIRDALKAPILLERCRAATAVVSGDRTAAAATAPGDDPLASMLGARAYVVAAVRRDGQPVGVLHASHADRNVDDLDHELLAAFSEICGLVMQRIAVAEQLAEQNAVLWNLARAIAGADTPPDSLALADPCGSSASNGHGDGPVAALLGPLSRREREVFTLIVNGASNAEIASELVIAAATAKSHVQSILRKFGVSSRLQAIAKYDSILHAQTKAWPDPVKLGETVHVEIW
jgi:DNA-binding CsgD family transcriptional regulator